MKDYIIPNIKKRDQFSIIFIILITGIFISIGINFMLYVLLIKTMDYDGLFISLFISFILTLITLFMISYIFVYNKFRGAFMEYSLIEQIILMPTFVIFFAIYILESPVLLWDITSVIFNIYMFLIVKQFVYVNYKSKIKVKEMYKRVI